MRSPLGGNEVNIKSLNRNSAGNVIAGLSYRELAYIVVESRLADRVYKLWRRSIAFKVIGIKRFIQFLTNC